VVLAASGVVLTSEHVVRDAGQIVVTLADGSERVAVGVAADDKLDLAVLRIVDIELRPLVPAFTSVNAGTPVVAVSACCRSEVECLRTGIVTNPAASLQNELDPMRTRQYGELIESTTELEQGFSGSPLVDKLGRFIGLNVAVVGALDRDTPRGYAIPFNDRVRDAVARLVAKVTATTVESREGQE
jgi:S1-C subfamily serine protease